MYFSAFWTLIFYYLLFFFEEVSDADGEDEETTWDIGCNRKTNQYILGL